MSKMDFPIPAKNLDRLIYEIQGQKVMLDADLAAVYGVTTKALNQAVKRNADRFPSDFVFQVTREETEALRSQIVRSRNRSQFVTGSQKHRDPRYLPYAFTEHGAIMAANVLNSSSAVRMSVFVVRAFLKMRAALSDNRELARKLAALEKELKDRLNVHEAAIVTILQRVMDIIVVRRDLRRDAHISSPSSNASWTLSTRPPCQRLRRRTSVFTSRKPRCGIGSAVADNAVAAGSRVASTCGRISI